MPENLFKAAVQTSIYLFDIGKKHDPSEIVKFIDFRNDGYLRRSIKKSSKNLQDDGTAEKRYKEVVDIINNNNIELKYLKRQETYIESKIDPDSGKDWNFESHIDFHNTISEEFIEQTLTDFVKWEFLNILSNNDPDPEIKNLFLNNYENSIKINLSDCFINTKEIKIGDLFEKVQTSSLKFKAKELPITPSVEFPIPALTASTINQGLSRYVPKEGITILKNIISVSANGSNSGTMFFQNREFTVLQDSYAIKCKYEIDEYTYLFLLSILKNNIEGRFSWTNKANWNKIKEIPIKLPMNNKEQLDFEVMNLYVKQELIKIIKPLQFLKN